MAGWGDYGWDHLSSRLNFAEGGEHRKWKGLHICAARELGRGKASPGPPIPPLSCNQLLTTHPLRFAPVHQNSLRPGTRATHSPTHTHTCTHTCTLVTRTPPRLGRGAPRLFPHPYFALLWIFFKRAGVSPGQGKGADIMGEIRCTESNMAKNKYFWSVNLTFFPP